MKRYFILILIMFVVLQISCTNASENHTNNSDNPTPTPYIANTSNPILLNTQLPDEYIKLNSLNIAYPAYIPMRYGYRTEWKDYIYNKFGIEIDISYKGFELKDIFDGTFVKDTLLYLGFTDYYTYEMNSDVYQYCNETISYDLSPYYKKYGWENLIDSSYFNKLVINGSIYAVPAVGNQYIIPRRYNKEYLGQVGMDVPKNTAEFLDYLRNVKVQYSDEKNFYPMCVDCQRFTPSTSDIFRAFGAYVNSQSNSTVSYNPQTQSFEDAVFSDDFDQALSYIQNLRQENLLFLAGYSGSMMSEGGKNYYDGINKNRRDLATDYWFIWHGEYECSIHENWDIRPTYETLEGYYLSGTNEAMLCEVRRDLSFYIFPKTIENIYGTMELFNDIFTNPDAYGDLKYGRPEYDYIVEDESILPIGPVAGAYLNLIPILGPNKNDTGYYPESRDIFAGLPKDLWFEKNVFTEHSAYHNHYSDEAHFGYGNPYILDSLFNENLSISDSIAQYMIEFQESGRRDFIQNMNDRLGAVTSYDYNLN